MSPHAVISLTAPKLCMRGFAGRHFVGGRFVPPSLASELDFEVPEYPGDEQVVEVPLVLGEHGDEGEKE